MRNHKRKNQSRFSEPLLHQNAKQIQNYHDVLKEVPLGLTMRVRHEVSVKLNQVLADTITLRDMYKKCHWQVSGATFYQLHLLFDKHYTEQNELVDIMAERIQLLGGISIAMAHEVVELSSIPRPVQGREEVPVQISRLLEAHEIIVKEVRSMAKKADEMGDYGSNDLLISNVLRTNELQTWFLYEHLVKMPLVVAQGSVKNFE